MGIVTATVNPNVPTTSQITNGDPGGEVVFPTATTPGAFFGGTPIVQPASQGSLRGVAGTITVQAVTVTATSVAPNTTAEQTFTVTAAIGAFVIAQKPTVDAGISIVGARVTTTNTVGLTYANDTAATITPTATQTYTFEVIPAAMTISATLSPSAVGPNVFAEQLFTVNGVPAGSAVAVNKPTAQAGLGILDARVVSAGLVGITFGNFTAATITPTASESYLFFASAEVDIAPVFKALTAALTPVSVAANTSAEQTFTVPGLLANSQVFVNKPSATAGLGIGGARVSAANTLAINFVNNTAAAIIPPAETYTVGFFPGAAPAAGSTTSYNSQMAGSDHAALVALGLVAAP